MDRVTIIGGTGFVGDYLVELLSKDKQLLIKVLYRKTPPTQRKSDIKYLRIDGALDFISLKKVLLDTDYLIILSRPNKTLINNITESDLRFKKILYASTILIYPNSELRQDERSKLEPANDYESQKIEEEKLLSEFAKRTDNKLIIARLTNVYGDKKNRALIHWILTSLIKDQAFKLNNNGEAVRDFIFVEDAAKYLAALLFLEQKSKVEIFNVCTGLGFSINQVIKIVEEISGEKLKIAAGDRTDEKLSVIGDNKKIVMETGIQPSYNLKSGLEKAHSNYMSHKIELAKS